MRNKIKGARQLLKLYRKNKISKEQKIMLENLARELLDPKSQCKNKKYWKKIYLDLQI